jgi:hypothetical protein
VVNLAMISLGLPSQTDQKSDSLLFYARYSVFIYRPTNFHEELCRNNSLPFSETIRVSTGSCSDTNPGEFARFARHRLVEEVIFV